MDMNEIKTSVLLTKDEIEIISNALHVYRTIGESLNLHNIKHDLDLPKIEHLRCRFAVEHYKH